LGNLIKSQTPIPDWRELGHLREE